MYHTHTHSRFDIGLEVCREAYSRIRGSEAKAGPDDSAEVMFRQEHVQRDRHVVKGPTLNGIIDVGVR